MDRLTEHETLVAAQIEDLITNAMTNSERSRWAAEHHIGVSDIGHCREYVRRVLTQEEPSQEANGAIMAAFVGTALGDLTERELVKMYPDAIVQRKVNVSLEVGEYQLNLPGHPDVIRPGEVLDFKSKNGLAVVERTLQQEFQLVLYGKAAIDAGLVEREGLKLTLAYLDRSGAFGPRPVVHSWLYDEAQVEEAQQWLADVFYAIENEEEASRDKPRSWCEMWCFAGETEIITANGLRRLEDLVDQEVQVLSPARQEGGLSGVGQWTTATVREYGVQPLRKITLGRGRTRKTVYATGGHRWFVTGTDEPVTTDDLVIGSQLRTVRHAAAKQPVQQFHWKVVSVEETDRVEMVYCAEVPDVECFALADFILTHNCKFAPACRGGDSDVTGLIEDEEIALAAKVYGEAVRAESKARRDKASAKAVLQGVSGHTSDYSIRWTSVPPSETPCEDPVHYRKGYEKIEVKERKRAP